MKTTIITNQSVVDAMNKINKTIFAKEITNRNNNEDRVFIWNMRNERNLSWKIRGRVRAVEPYKTEISLSLMVTLQFFTFLAAMILFIGIFTYKHFIFGDLWIVILFGFNLYQGYRYKKNIALSIEKIMNEEKEYDLEN